jgi:hypothetical protein
VTDLPPELREAFAAARSHYQADPARLERVREQVLASAGSSAGRLTSTIKLGLVVAVFGLTVLGSLAVWSAQPARPSAESGIRHQSAEPPVLSAPEPVSAPPQARAATAPRTESAEVVAAPAAPSRAPGARFSSQTPAREGHKAAPALAHDVRFSRADAAPEPADLLLDEAALIEAAREALGAGDTERAASQLRTHALRHPAGQLQVERVALRTLLACAQRDRGAARSAFAQLVLLHPPAALRLSMVRTCGAWISE